MNPRSFLVAAAGVAAIVLGVVVIVQYHTTALGLLAGGDIAGGAGLVFLAVP